MCVLARVCVNVDVCEMVHKETYVRVRVASCVILCVCECAGGCDCVRLRYGLCVALCVSVQRYCWLCVLRRRMFFFVRL